MDVVKSRVTNTRVGKMLGISESMVSRIRSNDRSPGFEVMKKVATELGWTFESQARARSAGNYGNALEEVLKQRFHD